MDPPSRATAIISTEGEKMGMFRPDISPIPNGGFDIMIAVDPTGRVHSTPPHWRAFDVGSAYFITTPHTGVFAGPSITVIGEGVTSTAPGNMVAPTVEAAIAHVTGTGLWPVVIDARLAESLIDSPYLRAIHFERAGHVETISTTRWVETCPRVSDEFVRKCTSGVRTMFKPTGANDPTATTHATFVARYAQTRDELAFRDLLGELLVAPARPNRTATPTRGLFARQLRFELTDGRGPILPVITLKRTAVQAVFHELLWFLRGSTDTKYLRDNGVTIWCGNTSRKALDSRELEHYEPGECGPIYGYQWRNWGGIWRPKCIRDVHGDKFSRTGEPLPVGIDQLTAVIDAIKADPFGRRHIVSAWNVEDLPEMALPPCHYAFQFHVDVATGMTSSHRLNCVVSMRSADVALGVPFNIASYGLLTHMIARLVDMTPGTLVINMADCHIYEDHVAGVTEMLAREPRRPPTLTIPTASTIDEYTQMSPDQFVLGDYKPHPRIALKMAV